MRAGTNRIKLVRAGLHSARCIVVASKVRTLGCHFCGFRAWSSRSISFSTRLLASWLLTFSKEFCTHGLCVFSIRCSSLGFCTVITGHGPFRLISGDSKFCACRFCNVRSRLLASRLVIVSTKLQPLGLVLFCNGYGSTWFYIVSCRYGPIRFCVVLAIISTSRSKYVGD